MEIAGHAAVVTGGGSGMGAETARRLAGAGAKVAVLDLDEAAAGAVGAEVGGSASPATSPMPAPWSAPPLVPARRTAPPASA